MNAYRTKNRKVTMLQNDDADSCPAFGYDLTCCLHQEFPLQLRVRDQLLSLSASLQAPNTKALSKLLWSEQGLCLSGSSQSKIVYPSICWRFLRGLPKSNGFSPGAVWRMANTCRSPVLGSSGGASGPDGTGRRG